MKNDREVCRTTNVNHVLREDGLTVEDVMGLVKIEVNDTVFVAGSVSEGFSNLESDLDVYVICENLPSVTPNMRQVHMWLSSGNYEWYASDGDELRESFDLLGARERPVHVSYIPFPEMAKNLAETNNKFSLACTIFDELPHSFFDFDFHFVRRLSCGVCFAGSDWFDSVRSNEFLARVAYLNFRRNLPGYDAYRDIKGAYVAGDFRTALRMAEQYVYSHFFAYLCLEAGAVLDSKWFFQYGERLTGDGAGTFASLKACFERKSDKGMESTLREIVVRLMELDRATIEHVLVSLDADGVCPSSSHFVSMIERALPMGDTKYHLEEGHWWHSQFEYGSKWDQGFWAR